MNFNNQIGEEGGSKGRFFVFVGVFLMIMLVAGGGYFGWNRYFSQEAKTQRNYQKYLDWQANYEKAMKEDTYGGKTPQETLDMFIAALKKGDVDLASKYFVLNELGEVDSKWLDALKKAKEENRLQQIIEVVSRSTFDSKSSYAGTAWFTSLDDEGNLLADFLLEKNSESNIWKIESL